MDVLWLLIKAGADINALSQHRRTVASSISIILGIVNIFKYLMEFRACTPPVVRVLAYIHRLRKN
jgi:hypothetical protein